jgi:hypothetical protein
MADEAAAPRSRRALLTAAAGAAGALAASAVLPMTAAATDPDDVRKGADNPTTATTSITNSTSGSTAFAAATTDDGFGLQGTSTGAAGVVGWSVAAPGGSFTPAATAYSGVFGSAPADPVNAFGTGVWGDSDDTGVFGSGGTGVYGFGSIGVMGESSSASAGVLAIARSATDLALDVQGKVRFSRSGRSTIGARKSSIVVTLPGVSTSSRIFAVLHTNRTGRWVQSVVPVTGKFTIYLNGTVTASTYVAWFVLN